MASDTKWVTRRRGKQQVVTNQAWTWEPGSGEKAYERRRPPNQMGHPTFAIARPKYRQEADGLAWGKKHSGLDLDGGSAPRGSEQLVHSHRSSDREHRVGHVAT